LLCALLLTRLRELGWFRLTGRQVSGVAVAVVVVLAVLTAVQNRRWQNEDALWNATLAHAPRSRVVRLKLGERAEQRQDLEGALREYDAALAVHPDIIDALNNAAFVNSRLARWTEATANFERIVELTPNKPIAHYNLAIAYGRQKRLTDAHRELGTAIELDPSGPRAGEWRKGLEQLEKALAKGGVAVSKSS
jgi:tetratricopeptide (TPR) repeat protein